MSKRFDSDLIRKWKITLPATLAGRVEYMLISPISQKPIYSARARLVRALLEDWVARESGASITERPPVPTLEELRSIE